MQMIFKVAIEIPAVGSVPAMRRTFCFTDRREAEVFSKMIEQHTGGVKLAGTSIDHLMGACEALDEVDEEIEMATRVAHVEGSV